MCYNYSLRRFCEEWRIWIRPLLIVTYAIFAIIVVPLLIVNSVKDGFSRKDQLILIGGLFVLSAVPVSIWHIIQHVIHFTKPILQKHIVRILWMVPIYALNAWIGLCFPKHSIYVDSLRECYEAYVIYNFMVYLLNYLNLNMDLEVTMEYKPQVYHFFPLCCLRPWVMGREFIHNCKHGILQYTVFRPITTFISVICELCGVYGEGTFAANVAFPYIVAINNISQFVAMYCLVLFYKANKNFLICIEMFIAAVAHMYSFPHYPFHINLPQYWNNFNHNWCRAFLSMIDISDIQEDVTEHFGVVSSSISRRFQGRTNYQPLSRGHYRVHNESEYLINKDGSQSCLISDETEQSALKAKETLNVTNPHIVTTKEALTLCESHNGDISVQDGDSSRKEQNLCSRDFTVTYFDRKMAFGNGDENGETFLNIHKDVMTSKCLAAQPSFSQSNEELASHVDCVR